LCSIARHGDTKIGASCHASARRAIAVNYIPLIDRDRPARVGNSARRKQRGQTRLNAQARISRRVAFDLRLPITYIRPGTLTPPIIPFRPTLACPDRTAPTRGRVLVRSRRKPVTKHWKAAD
jgi:hypothetical protein